MKTDIKTCKAFSHAQASRSRTLQGIMFALVSSTIVGCGGTGQDEGTPSTFSQDYRGLAIDGYLARATVFLDTNNDGQRNAWEPFAFTDNEGYYSYNPNTDTNYCASDATAEQAQYCLRTNTHYTNVVVRIDGGYDVMTGEPFVGQLSRRFGSADEGEDIAIISPITSLLSGLEDETEQEDVLSSLNLDASDIDVNYLNTDGAGRVDSNILNAALKVHKVVAVLSDRLTDTYDEIGEEIGTPNDATSTVYPSLAGELLRANQSFDITIQDSSSLASVLDSAEQALREVYMRKEFALPIDMGSASNPGDFSRVIDQASNVVDIINSVIDPTATDVLQEQTLGQIRAVESVVIKVLEETNTDTSVENAVSFFGNEGNGDLVSALLDSLSSDSADVSLLSANDFEGADFDSTEDVAASAQLSADTMPFTQIGGLKLRVSDLDLGRGPDRLDDSEIELYFEGEADDLSGAFSACVKHIDDANENGSLGEGSSRGEIVDGFWSLLGASSENTESYSLLITLTFLGTTYQAIMKPAGVETVDQIEYNLLRFDNDGELNSWHSLDGLVPWQERPTNNAQCEQVLPSRIGL